MHQRAHISTPADTSASAPVTGTGASRSLGLSWIQHPEVWLQDWRDDPAKRNVFGVDKITHLTQVMPAVEAAMGNIVQQTEPRWEEVAAAWQHVNLPEPLKSDIFKWLETRHAFPGKRGTTDYTDSQVETFCDIVRALKAGKVVTVTRGRKSYARTTRAA